MSQRDQRAVVIGASVAGLLAARVLADAFGEVVLLERDRLPDGPAHRRGAPQGRHTHVLLPRGRDALEELFPGLTAELVARGAPLARSSQARRFIEGGYYCRFESPLRTLLVSRPLLEARLRARVLARPNVRALEGVRVLGPAPSDNARRVAGVRLARGRDRAGGGAEETLGAALTVDATGRGSRAPAWLEALGYPPPEEERVEVDVGYATRHYRREPHHLGGDLTVMVTPTAERRRAAVLTAEEGERWSVTLAGYRGDHPPADGGGFAAFAAGLAAPDVHDLVSRAEPLGEPVPARFPANLRRRYERLARFPEGLLVLGDAICGFNPLYGQGMTVAALQALALRGCLAAGADGLAGRFFRAAARAVDTPWTLTVGNDRRLVEPGAAGGAGARALRWYLGRLHLAARRDPAAAQAFLRVVGLIDPPAALLRPRLAARVLRRAPDAQGRAEADRCRPGAAGPSRRWRG
jgi:2-polyprenyl-6-methoxyphenol hydroxylase-like FAD-dependent oxidoreductase